MVHHELLLVGIAGRMEVQRQQTLPDPEVVLEFLLGQLRSTEALGHAYQTHPVPLFPVKAALLLPQQILLTAPQSCC